MEAFFKEPETGLFPACTLGSAVFSAMFTDAFTGTTEPVSNWSARQPESKVAIIFLILIYPFYKFNWVSGNVLWQDLMQYYLVKGVEVGI